MSFRSSFHCLTEESMMFICMTEETVKKMKAYSFLEGIREKVYLQYTPKQLEDTIAYGINFNEQLKKAMVSILCFNIL